MTELIWGWGAFVFGLVGMLLAIATTVCAVIALFQANTEYKKWKAKEDERQYEINLLKQEIIDYTKKPFGETSFNEYTQLVNRLLRLDLYTKNPLSSKEEIPVWWALFNMVQHFQIKEHLEQKTNKPDSK
jgi:hypothetical protein